MSKKLHSPKAVCAEYAQPLQQQKWSQPSLLKGPGSNILMPSAGIAFACLGREDRQIKLYKSHVARALCTSTHQVSSASSIARGSLQGYIFPNEPGKLWCGRH